MSVLHGNDNQAFGLNVAELAGDTFGTPSSGRWGLYFKSGGAYIIDDVGAVSKVSLDGSESFDTVTVSEYYTFSDGLLSPLDALKPGIYMSKDNSGSYPFDSDDHLIIQAASDAASKDIVFIVGDSPFMAGLIDSTGTLQWIQKIIAGDGNVVAPNAAADDIVVDITGGGGGISILTDNNQVGALFFGDSGDDDVGGVFYTHSTNTLSLRAGATNAVTVTSDGLTVAQDLVVGATTGLARAAIVGSANEIQFLVRANATQTSAVWQIQNSSGSALASLSNDALFSVGNGTGAPQIRFNGAANSGHGMVYMAAGLIRWSQYLLDAESGSNAGSNYYMDRWNDAGSPIGNTYTINRATGLFDVANVLRAGGVIVDADPGSGVASTLTLTNATGTPSDTVNPSSWFKGYVGTQAGYIPFHNA